MSSRAIAPVGPIHDPSALSLALPDVRPLTAGVAENETGGIKGRIASLARQMADPVWGAEGTINGMETVIETWRLWTSPLSAISYPDNEVQALAQSIRETGRVEKPLVVTLLRDPRSEDEGGFGGDHLVIDGEMTLEAAAYVPLEYLPVVYRSYESLWDATRASVAAKTAVHVLKDVEIGRLIRNLFIAHRVTQQRRPDLHLANLTQEEIGRILGRAQPTISKWLKLAKAAEESENANNGAFATHLYNGAFSPSVAEELLFAETTERDELAERIVETTRITGKTPTHREAREMVTSRKRGPVQHLGDMPVRPPQGLWLPEQDAYPSAYIIASHIHDLTLWLRQVKATLAHPHRELLDLLNALEKPTLVKQVQHVAESYSAPNIQEEARDGIE